MTVIADETGGAARQRADLVTGLQDLAVFLATHPDTPLPVVRANWRVPVGPRGERVAYLDGIAELLGAQVEQDDMGNLIALRNFGPVPAEAHLAPEDRSMSAWRRSRALSASQAASGMGATA